MLRNVFGGAAGLMFFAACATARAGLGELHLDMLPASQPPTRPGDVAGSHHGTLRPAGLPPRSDYPGKPYSAEDQYAIYGAKHLNPTQRPLLEIGEELYGYGPVNPANFLVSARRIPSTQHLWVYGDWRNGIGYNDNGKNHKDLGVIASRLNLDVDLQFTSTERIHAFIRPIDKNGNITRYTFSGGNEGLPRRARRQRQRAVLRGRRRCYLAGHSAIDPATLTSP